MHLRPIRITKPRVIIAAIIVGAILTTVAWAAWTLTQSGSGSAKIAGALQPLTFGTPTVSPTSLLLPGGKADVYMKVTNPNSSAVTITQVDEDFTATAFTAASSSPGTCPGGNLGLGNLTFTAGTPYSAVLSISVPPGTSDVTIPNAVSLKSNAPVACAGLDVTVSGIKLTTSVGS